jgi:hypothetical protein
MGFIIFILPLVIWVIKSRAARLRNVAGKTGYTYKIMAQSLKRIPMHTQEKNKKTELALIFMC